MLRRTLRRDIRPHHPPPIPSVWSLLAPTRPAEAIAGGVWRRRMERVKGIEPSSSVWKTVALPLSYTRIPGVRADTRNREPAAADVFCRGQKMLSSLPAGSGSPEQAPTKNGGWGWVRTSVDIRQRIYSPPPLATRAPIQSWLPNGPNTSTSSFKPCQRRTYWDT
jgi:hypothetical protein